MLAHVHYLFDRLTVSGHNPITMTNRAALNNARLANYSAKVERALNAQLAAERAELILNAAKGSPMAIANRNAIADLLARGAK